MNRSRYGGWREWASTFVGRPGLRPITAEPEPMPPWTLSAKVMVAGIVAIHLTLIGLFMSPPIGWTGDDAEYVMLSRELRSGQYADTYDVEAPVHARYPPGYPAILAAVSAVAGENTTLFVVLNAAFSAGMLVLVLDATRRRYRTDAVLAVALLVAINPETVLWAGRVMSESLFAFLIVLAVWAEQHSRSSRYSFLAGAAMVGSALVRTAGTPLVGSLILVRALQRRWIPALALVVAAVLTAGAWTAYTLSAPEPMERNLYAGDLQELTDGEGAGGLIRSVAIRLPYKLRAVTVDHLPASLSIPVIPENPADNLFGAIVLLLLLPVGLVQVARWWPSAAAGLLVYGLANVVWPWTLVRFIVPVNALIIACLVSGAVWWRERLHRPRLAAMVLPALVIYFSSGAILRYRDLLRSTADCENASAYVRPGCYAHSEWALFQATFFVRDSTPANDLVFTEKAAPFYYHSGHRTVNARRFLQSDSLELADRLRAEGVTWVVTSRVSGERSRHARLVASACRDFDLAKSVDAYTTVLRVRPAGAARDWGAACDATRIWRLPLETPG